MFLLAASVLSVTFGRGDEALTHASLGIVSQTANSPLTWAAWSVLIGLAAGRWRLGLVAGSISSPLALGAFFVAHYADIESAGNAVLAWLPVGILAGLAGAALGVAGRVTLRQQLTNH